MFFFACSKNGKTYFLISINFANCKITVLNLCLIKYIIDVYHNNFRYHLHVYNIYNKLFIYYRQIVYLICVDQIIEIQSN